MRRVKRVLKRPLAWLIGQIVARPRLKLLVRSSVARFPPLAWIVRSLTAQSSFVPQARRQVRRDGAPMSPRVARIYRQLRKESAARPK